MEKNTVIWLWARSYDIKNSLRPIYRGLLYVICQDGGRANPFIKRLSRIYSFIKNTSAEYLPLARASSWVS